MRRLVCLLALPLLALSQGCAMMPSNGCKPGLTITYTNPPTVSQQAIVTPQQTAYSAQGLACGPTVGGVGLYAAEARPLALQAPEMAPLPARLPTRDLVPSCTLDEVCRLLREGNGKLDRLLSRPMPPGQED